jgi:hypothetical protein
LEDQGGGLLANSLVVFSKSGDIIRSNFIRLDLWINIGFSLTNHELSIKIFIIDILDKEIINLKIEIDYIFIKILDYQRNNNNSCVLGIFLTKLGRINHYFIRSYGNYLKKSGKIQSGSFLKQYLKCIYQARIVLKYSFYL